MLNPHSRSGGSDVKHQDLSRVPPQEKIVNETTIEGVQMRCGSSGVTLDGVGGRARRSDSVVPTMRAALDDRRPSGGIFCGPMDVVRGFV